MNLLISPQQRQKNKYYKQIVEVKKKKKKCMNLKNKRECQVGRSVGPIIRDELIAGGAFR